MPEPERLTLHRHVERRAQGRCEYGQSSARYATHTFALECIIPRQGDHIIPDDVLHSHLRRLVTFGLRVLDELDTLDAEGEPHEDHAEKG